MRWRGSSRAAAETGPPRALVVGGGATGCEAAANIDALARLCGAAVEILVADRARRLLPAHPKGASRSVRRALASRGIQFELSTRIVAVGPDVVVAADGRRFMHDLAIVATGLKPPALVHDFGLPAAADGGLRVDAKLRSVGDGRIFGAGDCASLEDHDLPKLGVYAVREAPVLLENLLAAVTGGRRAARFTALLDRAKADLGCCWTFPDLETVGKFCFPS